MSNDKSLTGETGAGRQIEPCGHLPSPSPGPSASTIETEDTSTNASSTDLNFLMESPFAMRHAADSIADTSVLCRALEEKGDYRTLKSRLDAMPPEAAAALYWRGVVAMRSNDTHTAKTLFHDAKKLYRDDDHKADCNSRLAMCFWREHKLHEAFISLVAAQALTADPYLLAIIHINAGIVLAAKGDHAASLEQCRQAEIFAKKTGNVYLFGLLNLRYGNAHQRSGAHSQAIGFYELAWSHFEECGHIPYQALTLNNLASVCVETKQLNDAANYLRLAQELVSGSNDAGLLNLVCGTAIELVSALQIAEVNR